MFETHQIGRGGLQHKFQLPAVADKQQLGDAVHMRTMATVVAVAIVAVVAVIRL